MLASLLAGAVVLAACAACITGGGDSKTSPPVTTGPTVEVPASGVSEVDQIERAAVAGDPIMLAELTGYSKVACVKRGTTQVNIGEAPTCEPDEVPGTELEALPVTQCGGGWARPVAAPDAYKFALAGSTRSIDSAYKAAAGGTALGGTVQEDYVVVVRVGSDDGSWRRVAFHLSGGRVVWMESACPGDADLATPQRVEEFLIAPTTPVPTDITVEPVAP